MNDGVWSTGGMLQDKREILGEKNIQVPVCPPQIPKRD